MLTPGQRAALMKELDVAKLPAKNKEGKFDMFDVQFKKIILKNVRRGRKKVRRVHFRDQLM